MEPQHRTARAVVTHHGACLGVAPTFSVATPWWADVEPVTRELAARLGTPATVLRLVSAVGGHTGAGGLVTYHVDVAEPPSLEPGWQPATPDDLAAIAAGHPRRVQHADPAGLVAHLAWADAELAALGRSRTSVRVQVKTWNLSVVYRLPTGDGSAWLKCVSRWQPPESAPIGAVAALDPALVPAVLAADPDHRRLLLDHVPGEDSWEPADLAIEQALGRWVDVQAALATDHDRDRLLRAGLGDWSVATLGERLTTAFVDVPGTLPPAERDLLLQVLDGLPARLRALADTGLPETLVHGDFHSGNWRFDGSHVVLVDWSDAAIGHPVLDLVCFLARLAPERHGAAIALWADRWRLAVPGSSPLEALSLARPLQPLQAALVYQWFLDHIEPSERPYHEGDPASMVRIAASSAG